METTRPPGFPGNPPARMPRAPTPARSPPPRPLRCGEITFRPTHDVGPHKQCIGAQSRGLRAPCERFAPWVTPGPRITRFRLAADLGRMGLDTHRVSNKVSKITSRHLVPLDRAFPAHALVHGSSGLDCSPASQGPLPLWRCRVQPLQVDEHGPTMGDLSRRQGRAERRPERREVHAGLCVVPIPHGPEAGEAEDVLTVGPHAAPEPVIRLALGDRSRTGAAVRRCVT